MKTKTKLSLSVGLLFLMILLLAAIGVIKINSLAADSNNILVANYNTLQYSRNMLRSLEEIQSEKKAIQVFEINLQNQKNNITETGEKEYTDNLTAHFNQLKENYFDTAAAKK